MAAWVRIGAHVAWPTIITYLFAACRIDMFDVSAEVKLWVGRFFFSWCVHLMQLSVSLSLVIVTDTASGLWC